MSPVIPHSVQKAPCLWPVEWIEGKKIRSGEGDVCSSYTRRLCRYVIGHKEACLVVSEDDLHRSVWDKKERRLSPRP